LGGELMTHLPNHIHYGHGVTFGASFGDFYNLTPVTYIGPWHHPHLELRCKYGFRMDLSPELAIALHREIPQALAAISLPLNVRNIRDAVGGFND
jgi:hypothetical protein